MKNVAIISRDIVLINLAVRFLSPAYRTVVFNSMPASLDYIYSSVPDLILVDDRLIDPALLSILGNLKEDPLFNQLPVLAVMAEKATLDIAGVGCIEDYIWRDSLEKELLMRVNLCIRRSEWCVEVNPLTRLPGNISINRQIQERLDRGETFALAYSDLDTFKPFNDKYGFSRGDEVIKISGRLIMNFVKSRQPQGSFVGHIGGDDFIYIMEADLIESTSRQIVDAFDQLIPTFYDPEDRERGFIESVDRQGGVRTFPIIGISIGITDNCNHVFAHYGEMTEVASEMKKTAKLHPGSCCRIDKRYSMPK